jgi:hypothetical protein
MAMHQNPEISIIIPAYNVARFLKDAISSALAQKNVDVEVIVVDDGSTDNTANLLTIYSANPRVHVITQENAGAASARNSGISASNGRYLGFLDGDDIWATNKATRHLAILNENPRIDLTYSWWRLIDENGRQLPVSDCAIPEDKVPGGLSFEGLLLGNFTGTSSIVICRAEAIRLVGGFDPRVPVSGEDLDTWLRIAPLRDNNIALIPEVLTLYRQRNGQATGEWRTVKQGWEAAVEKARLRVPDRVATIERIARARFFQYLSYIAYRTHDYDAARKLIWTSWVTSTKSVLADRRSLLLSAAIAAQALLPASGHRALESFTRTLIYRRKA